MQEWYQSLELHEVLALYLGLLLLVFTLVSMSILEYQENKLKKEEKRMFEDEDGIPRFIRSTDEQIGLWVKN